MEETFRVNRNKDAMRIFEQERVFGQINMLTELHEELRRENMELKVEVQECKRQVEGMERAGELMSEEMVEMGLTGRKRALRGRGGFRAFRSHGHGPFMSNGA